MTTLFLIPVFIVSILQKQIINPLANYWKYIFVFSILFSSTNGNTITCSGSDVCRGIAPMDCNSGEACTLDCDGGSSCRSTTINCPTGYSCTITCNGWDGCRDLQIHAEDSTDLTVIGEDITQHLQDADVWCPTNGGTCKVTCGQNNANKGACAYLRVYAQQSSSLIIDAPYGGNIIMVGAQIYCPLTGSCSIQIGSIAPSDQTGQMNGMTVYAAEAFHDVSISCFDTLANCYDGAPILKCTAAYNQQCNIIRDDTNPSSWQCQNGAADFCNNYSYNPTKSPSLNPTKLPTKSPSADPTKYPTTNPSKTPTKNPTIDPTKDPTNNPTIDPTVSPSSTTQTPTKSPSFNPTSLPTKSPSTNPTKNPTNGPTNGPTDIPSKDPTKSPSISPTTERSGSVAAMSTTLKVDNVTDLSIRVHAANGTFNQYHVIRTVNASLSILLDTAYTLTADIIKPNISINLLVNMYDYEQLDEDEIDSKELTVKIQQDLNKDSDIIYVVEVTETNQKQEDTKTDEFAFGYTMNELVISIISFLALVLLISYIDAKCFRINDYHRMGALIIAILQLLDMIYDCLFAMKIAYDPDFNNNDITSPLFILLLLSISFIVFPTFITLLQLHFEMKKWKRNDQVSQWMFDNTALLYIISALCGSSFVAVRVCCSNLLNLSYFDMPLNQTQKAEFYTKRIYSSIIFENVPQLVIQTVYLFISSAKGTETNHIVYASMAFSILSIFISILSMLTKKNILQSRDYVTIEVDVSGDIILANFKRCRNRYKILRKHLSLIFGINENIIEIKKPSQIPNGLRVHIIVHINNTSAIDTNCGKLINDTKKSGKLAKILQEAWSLSIVPIIGNITYRKYDSQDRKDNTVMIKAMSEQIKNNDTNYTNYTHIAAMNGIPVDGNPMNIIQMAAIPPITQINTDDTGEPGGEHIPVMIPSVVVITPDGDIYNDDIDSIENINNLDDNHINNKDLPALIPPVVATDYGKTDRYKNGDNTEESDNSDDDNRKLTVGTTGTKQSIIDYNTENEDIEVVDYVNNVDNVTVGNSKQ